MDKEFFNGMNLAEDISEEDEEDERWLGKSSRRFIKR